MEMLTASAQMRTPPVTLDLIAVPEPPTTEIVYKVASCRAEWEAAFRLIYRAYVGTGLIEANPYEMRVTPYHLLETTNVFVALYRDEVICTVTLVGDGALGVPMQKIYEEEIGALRQQGIRFGEVSCLADRRRELERSLPVLIKLTRLMAQFSMQQGMQQFVIAVHPRHSRFYRRFMAFEQFADERSYPTVQNRPAVACALDFARVHRERPPSFAHFFGIPIPQEELVPYPLPAGERDYFEPAVAYSGGCVPLPCQ